MTHVLKWRRILMTEHPQNPNPDYQDRDIHLTTVVVSIVVLLVICGFVFISMKYMFRKYDEKMYQAYVPSSHLATSRQLPDEPILQINEAEDLKRHRAYEDALLTEYKRQEDGTIRIPIERAIEVLAEQGLPTQ